MSEATPSTSTAIVHLTSRDRSSARCSNRLIRSSLCTRGGLLLAGVLRLRSPMAREVGFRGFAGVVLRRRGLRVRLGRGREQTICLGGVVLGVVHLAGHPTGIRAGRRRLRKPRGRKKGGGGTRFDGGNLPGSGVRRLVRHRLVNRIGDRLDDLLNLLVHLVELAFDHRPDIVRLASKLAQELPQAAGHLREALRSQKEQGRNGDDRELDTTDVEHVFAPSGMEREGQALNARTNYVYS